MAFLSYPDEKARRASITKAMVDDNLVTRGPVQRIAPFSSPRQLKLLRHGPRRIGLAGLAERR
jgi:hypothetical protein